MKTVLEECKDILAKWENGEVVNTVQMGGLGEGYEQCIQIMAFVLLRRMVDESLDVTELDEVDGAWMKWRDQALEGTVRNLQPSGAQISAALYLAAAFYRRGVLAVIAEADGTRHIQVQNDAPRGSEEE